MTAFLSVCEHKLSRSGTLQYFLRWPQFRPIGLPGKASPRSHQLPQRQAGTNLFLVRCVSDVSATSSDETAEGFYADIVRGRRFLCTQCGKCCTGAGEVWVSQKEVEQISEHLNIPPHQFKAGYTKSYNRRPGWYLLRDTPGTQDCIFLKDKLCTIHSVRPVQCSTYPWWPALMDDKSWAEERGRVCEGIDHEDATPCDTKEAASQLAKATEHMTRQWNAREPQSKF